MKSFKFVIYKEGKYFVSQCLNVEISSFGDTVDEAIYNLKEALDLYFEDEAMESNYIKVEEVMIGEALLNA